MNILPKKRWHVRNQDNRERVRRDEENARLEQAREEERIALAEQEARLSLLRKRNKQIQNGSNKKDLVEISSHINLFSAEQKAGTALKQNNEEYVKEKHAEKESYEKKIGLLTYVGQSSVEAKKNNERPWYLDQGCNKKDSHANIETDEVKKLRLDPMLIVEKSLKHHKKEKKEHKKKKKKKKKEGRKSPPVSSSSKSIEQLREERLKREKVERERANEFMYGESKQSSSKETIVELDPGRYSSQFNPHLARRKYDRHHPY